ncbi:MAG TPA: hypothetical protein ENO05_09575 [Bacteroides sp.]|nr:hypothetical protein [Bacteroides sp.]
MQQMKNRRPWPLLSVLALLLACSLPGHGRRRDPGAARLPNIVLICVEELGYSEVEPYGALGVKTPYINQLDRMGVRFQDAHSTASIGSLSRYSMLTGSHAFRSAGSSALPGMLKKAGYTTAVIGSWHAGAVGGSDDPNDESRFSTPEKGFDVAISCDGAEVLTEKADAFVQKYRKKPFFLYFSCCEPGIAGHGDPGAGEIGAGNSGVGRSGRTGSRIDAIERMDWCTGQLLRSLKKRRLLRKTLIIITSTGGPGMDEAWPDRSGEQPDALRPAGPFRGGRSSNYEGGTRIPTIVCWPGTVRPGISDALVSQVDLYASLAELTGQELEPGEAPDSHPLLNTWLGKKASGRQYLIGEGNSLSLRKGDWKYIAQGPDAEPGRQDQQLFHLASDVGENNDLSNVHPERTAAMATLLREMTEEAGTRHREAVVAGAPFLWENASVYFLLTDRFLNGDPSNDVNFDRTEETAVMRGFEGGDFRGVIGKLEEGYFDSLGVTALWLTPYFEQVHGSTDEGTGVTYGYHGYWTRDWTRMDPNYGTEAELEELIRKAHERGIRILMDVVINHTGPVTEKDPVWPGEWVRTGPPCRFNSYETTVSCTLVENLPDIRTGSDHPVELPAHLILKWEQEGRLGEELAELEAFFERTGFPRAPRFFIIKWLTDLVRRYGIDGYRLDTAKHVEESVWSELGEEARAAFDEWKREHPGLVLDDNGFFMVGEVYGYGISSGSDFDFGDRQVDYFSHGMQGLINFEFKHSCNQPFEELFSSYSLMLEGDLEGKSVLNYIASHDDGGPFDRERTRPMEAGIKLLLCPGSSQIYYGDESSRMLEVPGAVGDANLRGPMNWDEIESGGTRNGIRVRDVLEHYRRLGRFRRDHPAVGAGIHRQLSRSPYMFSRIYAEEGYADRVVVGLDLSPGRKKLKLEGMFSDGTLLTDYYSGTRAMVRKGRVVLDTPGRTVLLGME